MFTRTRIALAAAMIVASGSAAFASDFDPNSPNRFAAYAQPTGAFQFETSAVRQTSNDPYTGQPVQEINQTDRASSPYAGGVG